VLRLSDLPPGWTAQAHTDSPDVPGLDQQLATCLGVDVGLLNQKDPTNADSPDFSNANGGQVGNSVGYESTVGRARGVIAILRSPRMAPCLNSAIETFLAYRLKHPTSPADSIPAGITLGQPTTTGIPFPTAGDTTIAYRLVIPLQGAGIRISVYADFVFAVKGRAGVLITAEDPGSAPDSVLESRLLAKVVGRLAATT
jgi:hypothetical protein